MLTDLATTTAQTIRFHRYLIIIGSIARPGPGTLATIGVQKRYYRELDSPAWSVARSTQELCAVVGCVLLLSPLATQWALVDAN